MLISTCGSCSINWEISGWLCAAADYGSSSYGNCSFALGCRGYSDCLGRGGVQFCAQETHITASHINSNKIHDEINILSDSCTMKHQLGVIAHVN